MYLRFSKRTIRGYWQTACILCGKKALYHCGGDGYCSTHKANAVARRRLVEPYKTAKSQAIEAREKAFDDADLAKRRWHMHQRLKSK